MARRISESTPAINADDIARLRAPKILMNGDVLNPPSPSASPRPSIRRGFSPIRINQRNLQRPAMRHASLKACDKGRHQISIHHIDFPRFSAVDTFAREAFQPWCHLSMRMDCNSARRLAGLVQSRRLWGADVNPALQHPGEIPHTDCGLLRSDKPLEKVTPSAYSSNMPGPAQPNTPPPPTGAGLRATSVIPRCCGPRRRCAP
jgi:hypothetical protein